MKWVTRERIMVDRVACPWLIKKFADPNAEFVFLPHDSSRSGSANGRPHQDRIDMEKIAVREFATTKLDFASGSVLFAADGSAEAPSRLRIPPRGCQDLVTPITSYEGFPLAAPPGPVKSRSLYAVLHQLVRAASVATCPAREATKVLRLVISDMLVNSPVLIALRGEVRTDAVV
jgi:hypothetical protein